MRPSMPGDHGYGAMAQRMVDPGARCDGFLGLESARGADAWAAP